MKTACFFQYQGDGRVSIARSAPRNMSGFKVNKRLAPGSWFKSVDYQRYCELFAGQLAHLDPQETWDKLHEVVAPHEPVLLCWERQPLTEGNFCHRRIVARWFLDKLGHEVPEIGQGMVDECGRSLLEAREPLLV